MRVDLAWLDDLVYLDDRDPGALGEARIEVLRAAAELAVAEGIGTVGGDEGVVDLDGGLE